MRSPLLRSRWIFGHLLAMGAIVAFVFLGMWQLRRHDEKVVLRDAVRMAIEGPATPIEQVPEGSFRRVTAQGEYAVELQARVLRSRDGVSGYEVLTPLLLADGTAVLIDRGWVGIDVDLQVGGVAPRGGVAVEGILWPAQEGAGVPLEFPEFVRRVDPGLFEPFSGGVIFREEYLVLTGQSPPFAALLKQPEIGEVSLGPHLGYAGQWLLFAVVVAVGYPLLLRKQIAAASNRR